MIPLRSTERVYASTAVTGILIAVNVLVFLYQFSMDGESLIVFVERWGIIPDAISGNLHTLVTSMFLHGSWMHLLGNMLFLWVFGRNVEDLIGGGRFLVLYLCCGLAAAILQVITNPYSRVPTIGASGAIAGVMGAYLVKFPRARIITLVPIIIFITTVEIPAWAMLLWWFVIQLFSGLGSLATTDYAGGGIAWFAHVGGFVSGMLLIRVFPVKRRKWRAWNEED
jgi:membrane associated rhomboid family serine protease